MSTFPGATLPDEQPPRRSVAERNQLVEENLALVHWAIRRCAPGTFPDTNAYDEMASLGYLAMLRAATHFDPSRGVRFSTYAASCILHAMRDGDGVGRRGPAEVELLRDGEDAPAGSGEADPLADSPLELAEATELADAVEDALRHLHPRARDILVRRYWAGQTFDQVSRAAGVSRERVRQVERCALERLAQSCPDLAGHLPA